MLAASQVLLAQFDAIDIPFATIVQGYLAFLGAAVLTSLGWWQRVGFLSRPGWRLALSVAPIYVLPMAVLIGVLVAGPSVTDPAIIAGGALAYLLGAFGEEALFRGAVLQAFLPRGAVYAAVVSTAFFGLQHLGSLAAGLPVAETMIQMLIVAPLLGFGFAAARIATGAIWPLVLLHALINFAGYLAQGAVLNTTASSIPERLEWIGPIVLAEIVVLPLYGAWLLRRTSAAHASTHASAGFHRDQPATMMSRRSRQFRRRLLFGGLFLILLGITVCGDSVSTPNGKTPSVAPESPTASELRDR